MDYKAKKVWQIFVNNLKSGSSAEETVTVAFQCLKKQYGEKFESIILDLGVLKSADALIGKVSSKNLKNNALTVLMQVKKDIAINSMNSVFAEIAVHSLWKTLNSGAKNLDREFSVQYLSDVIDYFISREITEVIGHPGLANLSSLDKKLEDTNLFLREKAKQIKAQGHLDLIRALSTEAKD